MCGVSGEECVVEERRCIRMFPEREVLVTAALPYVNGECHIGHLRTYVPADIFTRTLRKLGYKVLFVCGSDTHAAKYPAPAHASLTSDPL